MSSATRIWGFCAMAAIRTGANPQSAPTPHQPRRSPGLSHYYSSRITFIQSLKSGTRGVAVHVRGCSPIQPASPEASGPSAPSERLRPSYARTTRKTRWEDLQVLGSFPRYSRDDRSGSGSLYSRSGRIFWRCEYRNGNSRSYVKRTVR